MQDPRDIDCEEASAGTTWRREPEDRFLELTFLAGTVTLVALTVVAALLSLARHSSWRLLGDAAFVAFLALLDLLIYLMYSDTRREYLLRRDSLLGSVTEPNDVVEGRLRQALGELGIGHARHPISGRLSVLLGVSEREVFMYELEGEDFNVVVKHFEYESDVPFAHLTLLHVGPVTGGNLVRVMELIQAYGRLEGNEVEPKLLLWGRGPSLQGCRPVGPTERRQAN